MSDLFENDNSQFLQELSEVDQETVTGGFGFGGFGGGDFFFFQQTNIESLAHNQNGFSSAGNGSGGVSAYSNTNSAYRFSQTTLAFGSFGGSSRGFSPWMWLFGQSFLARLLG